ncbi:PhzF family phenazine biosynthesis protein [Paenarthrobacter sp. Z7-10]|uniref:PhzF family phenazine biosynthesis protein n=1 Tax=Paenarthrobacter sp. Z7-10 TaxID=2787635 RepID=UPI0022A936CD|nr:PhzF family phenazine biosynthesis protein [Paenarthrobacter sp. Z7-10]MCZ2402521.1 PhzF family phenazine biosynthesis protein [Paenarthrobacter sp. Z7-10]
MAAKNFSQVDVFSQIPFQGNPVAVVFDADDLPDDQLAAFARWTNLSETTFLLPPTQPKADYRLRIFTPGGELPFAGHPTLGSCHAWLSSGNVPQAASTIVQECGAGLVRIRNDAGRLAFAAPPLRRTGPLEQETLQRAVRSLGIAPAQVLDQQWVDNGPGWFGLLLDSAASVLAVRPDFAAMRGMKIGLIGPHPAGSTADYEVRAFVPDLGVNEDPVTGSLNAGLAQWLIGAGAAPDSYTVRQGTVLGRDGRVHIDRVGADIWIGGNTTTCVAGTVSF